VVLVTNHYVHTTTITTPVKLLPVMLSHHTTLITMITIATGNTAGDDIVNATTNSNVMTRPLYLLLHCQSGTKSKESGR